MGDKLEWRRPVGCATTLLPVVEFVTTPSPHQFFPGCLTSRRFKTIWLTIRPRNHSPLMHQWVITSRVQRTFATKSTSRRWRTSSGGSTTSSHCKSVCKPSFTSLLSVSTRHPSPNRGAPSMLKPLSALTTVLFSACSSHVSCCGPRAVEKRVMRECKREKKEDYTECQMQLCFVARLEPTRMCWKNDQVCTKNLRQGEQMCRSVTVMSVYVQSNTPPQLGPALCPN